MRAPEGRKKVLVQKVNGIGRDGGAPRTALDPNQRLKSSPEQKVGGIGRDGGAPTDDNPLARDCHCGWDSLGQRHTLRHGL